MSIKSIEYKYRNKHSIKKYFTPLSIFTASPFQTIGRTLLTCTPVNFKENDVINILKYNAKFLTKIQKFRFPT